MLCNEIAAMQHFVLLLATVSLYACSVGTEMLMFHNCVYVYIYIYTYTAMLIVSTVGTYLAM